MAQSYNGWSAAKGWTIGNGYLEPLVVRGEPFSPGVRAGHVREVLQYVAEQLDARVEKIDFGHAADDWGYSFRANTNNPSQLSCHASGTAIDFNATRHPNGKKNTFSAAQFAEIDKILAEVNGTVRQLRGYDEMHFEICKSPELVKKAADKIRHLLGSVSRPVPKPSAPTTGVNEGVRAVQDRLNGLGFGPLVNDGIPGPKTTAAVKAFQFAAGIGVDGDFGPLSWSTSNRVPAYPGESARAFQQRLKDRGWKIVVDGAWGPNSTKILRSFQSEKGITSDGKMGPQSWTALWTRGL